MLNNQNELLTTGMNILLTNSRTFFIPISRLNGELQEAVASAYLCMRAIDEIEDHPEMPRDSKAYLLRHVSAALGTEEPEAELDRLFAPYAEALPEVTLRLKDWVRLSPDSAAPLVKQSTAVMASGMADWVDKNWLIQSREDLDHYTYCVAGAVGELLSDLWRWHDGTETDRVKAVAFGRGLQAVNILRNYGEDEERGVSFFPNNWTQEQMFEYARHNLQEADAYVEALKPGQILEFCTIPLALAHGTLEALSSGDGKLTREHVMSIVSRVNEHGIQ
ncbi:squalene/phytoene synthase family protein [Paenibacillus sp. 1P07SE]|uniref:squalene/phytoene synthase family protein n=1 Tax=Paenibacillus sp. 1P07SE TaxID=3132209 RepID=UPI0039A6BBEE